MPHSATSLSWHKPKAHASLPLFCCSVAQLCLTLGDPMDCSTAGFPVLRCLPEFAQTCVHWVGDAIQPPHPLSSPSPSLSLAQHQGLFQWVSSSHQVAKVLELQHRSLALGVPSAWNPLPIGICNISQLKASGQEFPSRPHPISIPSLHSARFIAHSPPGHYVISCLLVLWFPQYSVSSLRAGAWSSGFTAHAHPVPRAEPTSCR